MPSDDATISTPADLTPAWLSERLGVPVAGLRTERIGTGQMSESYRVHLDYDDGRAGPRSVVLKVAATDPTSRQTGGALGLYEREVRFYAEIAPNLRGPVAPCFHASYDAQNSTFALLMGDAGPAEVGDEIAGATAQRARVAVTALARLQGPTIGDPELAGAQWLNRESPVNSALLGQLWAGFADRYADRIAPRHREVCERLVESFDAYAASNDSDSAAMGLVHGDFRLDNLLFGTEGADRPLTVVDWQTVTWAPAMIDLAYFLGCALTVETRRAHGDALIAAYHAALGPDAALSLDEVRAGVRRQSFFGVMMAIVSSMLVVRTDRGDDMFMAMLERHCEQVLDTGALALLADAAPAAPPQPSASDESAHPAGPEPMWNESWYFDFVDAAQGVGGYVRLGLTLNEGVAWFNAVICGPGRPTIAVLDFEVPRPDDPAHVRTDAFDFSHQVTAPLATYRLTLHGKGQAHTDASAILRGEGGRPVDVDLDLTWTTAGTPYQYRITPRYEIPCTVSGDFTADGQAVTIADVAGQRDHSWGVRDWWGMDWVWSALHLADGTHVHGVDLRLPGAPPIGVGYVQGDPAPLVELDAVAARETFGANGLPVATTITYNPGGLEVDAEIRGHGPLRLVAPDGRVAEFARAWAAVTTSDGRTGVGWIEWNRNLGR